jgi:hypothetical protein
MGRSPVVVFLVIGLLVGALAGYLTRPESAEIKLGPIKLEVSGNQAARGDGPLTSSQIQHIAVLTAIGGAIGFGLGFAMGKRKG